MQLIFLGNAAAIPGLGHIHKIGAADSLDDSFGNGRADKASRMSIFMACPTRIPAFSRIHQ